MDVSEILAAWQAGAMDAVVTMAGGAAVVGKLDPVYKALLALIVTFFAGMGAMGVVAQVKGFPQELREAKVEVVHLKEEIGDIQGQLTVTEQRHNDIDNRLDTVICILEGQVQASTTGIALGTVLEGCRPDFPWRDP